MGRYDRSRSPPRRHDGPPANNRRRRSPSPPPRSPPPRYRRSPPPRSPPPYKRRREDYDSRPNRRYEERESPDRFRYREGFQGGGPQGYGNAHDQFVPPPPHMGSAPGNRSKTHGLMTYRQFMLTLSDDVTPAESMRLYEGFRLQHARRAREEYFQAHKEEDWLKSKFHPSSFESLLESRNRLALDLAASFANEVKKKTLDPLENCTESDDSEDADSLTAPGYSSCASRVEFDLRLSRKILLHLDKEKGIETLSVFQTEDEDTEEKNNDNVDKLWTADKLTVKQLDDEAEEEKLTRLDTQLCYLWRVHRLDYYGRKEMADFQEMQRTEANWGLRSGRSPHSSPPDDANSENPTIQAFSKWCLELGAKWSARVESGPEGEGELERLAGRRDLAQAEEDWLQANVRKIEEGKFGCMQPGCPKRFWGPDFVKKHLKTKHQQALEPVLLQARARLYKRNFLEDPKDLPLPEGGSLPHAGAAPPLPQDPPPPPSSAGAQPPHPASPPSPSGPPPRMNTAHYQVPPHGSPPPPPRHQGRAGGPRPRDYSPPPGPRGDGGYNRGGGGGARGGEYRGGRDRDSRDMDRDNGRDFRGGPMRGSPDYSRGGGGGGGRSLSPPRRVGGGSGGPYRGGNRGRDGSPPPYGHDDGYRGGGHRGGRDGGGYGGGWPEGRGGYDDDDYDDRRGMPPGRGRDRMGSPYRDERMMGSDRGGFDGPEPGPVPGPAPPPRMEMPPPGGHPDSTRMIPIGPPGPLPPGAIFVPLPGAGPMGPFVPMMPGPNGPVPIIGARPGPMPAMGPMHAAGGPPLPGGGGGMMVMPNGGAAGAVPPRDGGGPSVPPIGGAGSGPRPPPDGPHPPPPMIAPIHTPGGRDPRSIRQYVDLDAPGSANMLLDYRDL